MLQNVNAALLALSLYFSTSQPIFGDNLIMAEPTEKSVIQDYLQKHPIDKDDIVKIDELSKNTVNQLQQLPQVVISDQLKRNPPQKIKVTDLFLKHSVLLNSTKVPS